MRSVTVFRFFTSRILLACACLALPGYSAEPETTSGFFTGKLEDHWKVPATNPWWTLEDGVLTGVNDPEKKGAVLETKEAYGDVTVEIESRWDGEIDSGIFLRKGQKWQCQIGVSRSLKKDMTCSIYVPGKGYPYQAEFDPALLKSGDWNHIKIQAKGDHFTLWLNGQKVLEDTMEGFAEPGPVGLQIHGGMEMKVEFRNLQVTPGS